MGAVCEEVLLLRQQRYLLVTKLTLTSPKGAQNHGLNIYVSMLTKQTGFTNETMMKSKAQEQVRVFRLVCQTAVSEVKNKL